MFKAIKEFFFGKPQTAPAAAQEVSEAPYKVETPAFKPTADAAPVEAAPEPAAETPVKAVRKPRANVAAKKIAAAKKPAAKKTAAPPNAE
jgi:hypothetical protein